MRTGRNRRFLLLQGPHGPFFHQLGKMLRAAGAEVWRVGFNAGDRAFWPDRASYVAFAARQEEWPGFLSRLLRDKDITDLVLYGDTRPIHARAVTLARASGIRIHVFEEGYLRPYWITYERGGSNGNSRLMELNVADILDALGDAGPDAPNAPTGWGEMRHHVFYGALYHWFVLFLNGRYRHFRPHRDLSAWKEFRLYLRKLVFMPAMALERIRATRRIKRGGFPYHLALLQLEHDASFRAHSPFSRMSEFLELVIAGFAAGAPSHHHLVFKAHPLEDGRAPLRRDIRRLARMHGVCDRAHYLGGGKLAPLLDHASSAITVNSTAGQQALWRGLALKATGRAVYLKPEFTSDQPVARFFADPGRPDTAAYRIYRKFLLDSSQVAGGYYSARGRRRLLRRAADMMLRAPDPYDALLKPSAPSWRQLRAID